MLTSARAVRLNFSNQAAALGRRADTLRMWSRNSCRYGRIVTVMDVMRVAGLKRFAFAVQAKAAP